MTKKKKLKRIEFNEKLESVRVRASRTGGVNAAVSPARGVTYNTKHRLRVSKTYQGLTLGMQNLNSIVRGRWSSKDGRLNLNLSKSGLSTSVKSSLGTFNLVKPKRSSATIAGIQVRGKNALVILAVGLVVSLMFWMLQVAVVLSLRLALFAVWLIMMLWRLLKLLGSVLLFALLSLTPAKWAKKNQPEEEEGADEEARPADR